MLQTGTGCGSSICCTEEMLGEERDDERQGYCVQCEKYWPKTAHITGCQGEKIRSHSGRKKPIEGCEHYGKLLASISLLTVQTSRR